MKPSRRCYRTTSRSILETGFEHKASSRATPRQKSFWTSMMSRQSVGAAVMRGVFQRVYVSFCQRRPQVTFAGVSERSTKR